MIWKILIILNLVLNIFVLSSLLDHGKAIKLVADFLWRLYERRDKDETTV